jgi:hypothetical protein
MCRTDGSSSRLEVDPPVPGDSPAPGAALSGASSPGSQPIIAAGGSSSTGEARAQASGRRDMLVGSSALSSASAGSSAPSPPAEDGVSPASDPRGSTVQLDAREFAAMAPALGISPVAPSTSSVDLATSENMRPITRSQSGIVKPKVYTDGTVRWGMLASSSDEEPTSVQRALVIQSGLKP